MTVKWEEAVELVQLGTWETDWKDMEESLKGLLRRENMTWKVEKEKLGKLLWYVN